MSFELQPVSYKVIQSYNNYLYRIEQSYNCNGDNNWFIVNENYNDFHLKSFKMTMTGFKSLDEATEYLHDHLKNNFKRELHD